METLARLDEHRAELLEHAAQPLGREAVEDVVAADDGEDLADAREPRGAAEVRLPLAAAAEQPR